MFNPTKNDIDVLSDASIRTVDVAAVLNIGSSIVRRWRKNHFIKVTARKPGSGAKHSGEIKPCPVCGADVYYPKAHTKQGRNKCCSHECKRHYLPYLEKMRRPRGPCPKPIRNLNLSEYTRYGRKVHTLTRHTYEKHKDEINPNNYPRGLCGVLGAYQLDHIISIKEGWTRGLTPEELSVKENLQMLPWLTNLKKQFKNDATLS